MRHQPADLAGAASTVHRLAVLLTAGVPPAAAWAYLGGGGFAERVGQRIALGSAIPPAIIAELDGLRTADQPAWRSLAAAWSVATDAGAPLAPTLREVASSLRDLAATQRNIEVALAGPRTTARLVLVLPAVGILFGLLLGFNTIGTLVGTPIGWGCLAVGIALLTAARAWNRRLVRSAQPKKLSPGLEFDLTAIALSGGGALDAARTAVAVAMVNHGCIRDASGEGVDDILDLSRRAGVPAGELLRAEAGERRRSARAEAQAAAETLAIRLMLPLGVCVLPSFMVLGVMPLLVAVLSATSF
jgi:tight adherence protein B